MICISEFLITFWNKIIRATLLYINIFISISAQECFITIQLQCVGSMTSIYGAVIIVVLSCREMLVVPTFVDIAALSSCVLHLFPNIHSSLCRIKLRLWLLQRFDRAHNLRNFKVFVLNKRFSLFTLRLLLFLSFIEDPFIRRWIHGEGGIFKV